MKLKSVKPGIRSVYYVGMVMLTAALLPLFSQYLYFQLVAVIPFTLLAIFNGLKDFGVSALIVNQNYMS